MHILGLNYASDKELMIPVKSDVPWPTGSRSRLLVEVVLKDGSGRYHIIYRSFPMEIISTSDGFSIKDSTR
ncbi:hypothetical protein N0V92_013554 [Colletotrichum tropicale]|nr:hypothetical protein N0V92_013554 [Colletotrichum tropicale]